MRIKGWVWEGCKGAARPQIGGGGAQALAPTSGDDLGSQGLASNQSRSQRTRVRDSPLSIPKTVFLSSGWGTERATVSMGRV